MKHSKLMNLRSLFASVAKPNPRPAERQISALVPRKFSLIVAAHLATAILGLMVACGGEEAKTVDPKFAAVQEALERQLRMNPGATAAAVSISQGGKTIFASAAGRRSGRPGAGEATPNTLFNVASMTKPVTALAILALVQDGVISLDAPVATYIPQWQLAQAPQQGAAITIRQLLNHSSCLSDGDIRGESLAEFVERDLPPVARVVCAPGSVWYYSNWGYSVLGRLVERASGKEFGQFVRERVLQPLGMVHSTFVHADAKRGDFAEGHDLSVLLDPVPVKDAAGKPYGHPAGGLYTSAEDYARILPALVQSNGFLSEELRSAVQSSTVPTGLSGRGDRWGLGVRLYQQYPLQGSLRPLRAVQHDGNAQGASATSTLFIDRDVTVTAIINTFVGSSWAESVVRAALEVTGGLPPAVAEPPFRPAAEYVGTYENPAAEGRFRMARLEVQESNGVLNATGTMGDGRRASGVLTPVIEDYFNAPGDFGSYLTFIRDEAGAIRFATNRFTVLERTK